MNRYAAGCAAVFLFVNMAYAFGQSIDRRQATQEPRDMRAASAATWHVEGMLSPIERARLFGAQHRATQKAYAKKYRTQTGKRSTKSKSR